MNYLIFSLFVLSGEGWMMVSAFFWKKTKYTMKKIIITNGLIAGTIVSGMLLISQPLMRDGTLNIDNGMIVGYTTMVIALSMVFFGIKTYRDQYQNGIITFGQAFKIGILIAVIAALVYAVVWEIYFNTVATDFVEFYATCHIDKLQKDGASAAEITKAREDMAEFAELYKNPIIRFAMTLAEILPVGIIITLISAAVLRKKEILPA